MKTLNSIALGLMLTAVAGPASAAELQVSVRDQKGRPVGDAVVLAIPLDRKALDLARPARHVVDQVNKEFVPHVRVVYAGTSVSFPNKDNIRHHVYSFSPAKKFELSLYSGVSAPPVLFDKPGVVVLGCNIHDWMIGYIYVAESPFFAKTEREGQAVLENLPAGDYQMRLWHPDMEADEQTTIRRVSVADKAASIAWTIALKPSFRIPRPTGAGGGGYR